MNYTITYGGQGSIKYHFNEYEVMGHLQQKARQHTQKVLPKNAEMVWSRRWWGNDDGELIIEFTCEFKSIDIGKTEVGKV